MAPFRTQPHADQGAQHQADEAYHDPPSSSSSPSSPVNPRMAKTMTQSMAKTITQAMAQVHPAGHLTPSIPQAHFVGPSPPAMINPTLPLRLRPICNTCSLYNPGASPLVKGSAIIMLVLM